MAATQTATEPVNPEDLYTVSAGGFSATADAFARDPDSQELWFLSMVGPQTALKAIWASLLKQPPEAAHLIRGADGGELTGDYLRCSIPNQTIGTWTTKIARLPTTGGWHALVYTRDWRSSPSSGRTSSCWPAPGRRPRPCTTGSSTGAAPCPCTTPGPPGSGAGGCATARSFPSSPPGYRPGSATPIRRSSGTTCRTPWPWALSP